MTRSERFMKLPRIVRFFIVAFLLIPIAWLLEQPAVLVDLWCDSEQLRR